MGLEDLDGRRVAATQDEVARQILQEEAQRGLEERTPLKLTLKPPDDTSQRVYGPVKDEQFASRTSRDKDELDYRVKPLPDPSSKSVAQVRDAFIDKVIPGFGRIESRDDSWRFDYLDPSACDTKAQVGLCFKIKH